jgi:NAD+ synthase
MAKLSIDALELDAEREIERTAAFVRTSLATKLKRRGVVVAVSGGIDSSVVLFLCARAVGKQRVFALLLNETESSDETRALGRAAVESAGVAWADEDITPMLAAVGCYERRDAAIRAVVSDYGPGWKSKIVLPSFGGDAALRLFTVVALSPDGREVRARLDRDAYLGVVAATNSKQRIRKLLEYYHADRLNYAVAGTPNLLEYDQGFFVKNGDGAADFKPIAHLYKTQVYQLAEALGVPEAIRRRPPTTDTYSLAQSQEEFYFSLPYDKMDLALYALNNGYAPGDAAAALGLTPAQVERVYQDIHAKRAFAEYLHSPPLSV